MTLHIGSAYHQNYADDCQQHEQVDRKGSTFIYPDLIMRIVISINDLEDDEVGQSGGNGDDPVKFFFEDQIGDRYQQDNDQFELQETPQRYAHIGDHHTLKQIKQK